MLSVLNSLEDIFKEAVSEAFPDLPDAPCPITPSSKFGDYQFNGAMAIAGLLKGQGIKMPPRDVANKILEKVPKNDLIEKLDVAGPGFVNILISKSFVNGQITDILKHGVRAPLLSHDPKDQKVCFKFIFLHCTVWLQRESSIYSENSWVAFLGSCYKIYIILRHKELEFCKYID